MNIEEQSLTLVVQEMFMWKDQSLHDEIIDKYPGFQMDIPSDRIWIPPIYATKVSYRYNYLALFYGIYSKQKDALKFIFNKINTFQC